MKPTRTIKIIILILFLILMIVLASCTTQQTIVVTYTNGSKDTLKQYYVPSEVKLGLAGTCLMIGDKAVACDVKSFSVIK